MKHKIIIFALLSLAVIMPSGNTQELLDRIVAVVENKAITERELVSNVMIARRMLQQQNREEPDHEILAAQILQQMITRELQLQEAEKLGIRIDEITIDRQLNAMAQKNNMTLVELKNKMEQSGRSFEAMRENIRADLTIKQVVQQEVIDRMEVSEQEIKDFMIAKSTALNENLNYRFAHLQILPSQDKRRYEHQIQYMHKALNKENITNFTLLNKRVTELWDDLANTKNGANKKPVRFRLHDMGWRTADELPLPVKKRLHTISAGQQLPPIANSKGLHLFHLLTIHSGEQTMMQKKYHIRHILIRTTPMKDNIAIEKQLKKIKIKLRQDGNFAKAAQKYSEDPGSAYKGGDLGWSDISNFDPQFAAAALQAHQEGGIFGPFKSGFGWHLLEVLGAREDNVSDQATRNKAISRIKQSKLKDEVRLWRLKLREERHIEVFT